MKLKIQLISLLFSLSSFGQTKKTTTIEITTGDCRTEQVFTLSGADTILFYKLPQDTIAFKVISKNFHQYPMTLENIEIAEYKMTFRNSFGQLITKKINLNNQEINSLIICPDSLLNYTQNTLTKLKNDESISISFSSQGCFHFRKEKMIIVKKDETYIAKVNDGKSSLWKTVTLTKKNINDFIRFENEINFAKDLGCTTTNSYDIKSEYLNIIATDGSCNWRGYYFLKKSFFGVKE